MTDIYDNISPSYSDREDELYKKAFENPISAFFLLAFALIAVAAISYALPTVGTSTAGILNTAAAAGDDVLIDAIAYLSVNTWGTEVLTQVRDITGNGPEFHQPAYPDYQEVSSQSEDGIISYGNPKGPYTTAYNKDGSVHNPYESTGSTDFVSNVVNFELARQDVLNEYSTAFEKMLASKDPGTVDKTEKAEKDYTPKSYKVDNYERSTLVAKNQDEYRRYKNGEELSEDEREDGEGGYNDFSTAFGGAAESGLYG